MAGAAKNRWQCRILSAILLGSLCFSFPAFASSDLPVEAYGLDTIAGYSTVLRSSKTIASTPLVFELRKPNGEVVNLTANANRSGVAILDLSDYYTRAAGNYAVSASVHGRSPSDRTPDRVNYFVVHPGEVSEKNSLVSPMDQVVRSRTDRASVRVKLLDEFKNPIEGHLLKLISSSGGAEIETNSNISNQNGEVNFVVRSKNVGTAVYSIYDATADVVLDARAKVVYFDSNDYIFANSLGNSAGPVNDFEFGDVPDTIRVGESISVTISARDSQEQIVTNYTGTVRFFVEGTNGNFANLPEDYTFRIQDQGSHTFSLGFSFLQPGNYEVSVTDLVNTVVVSEQIFAVSEDDSGIFTENDLVISNPSAGTYSSNVQVISGLAPAGSRLKIFDNDIEIASLLSDVTGNFSYTTGVLLDGNHRIYVAQVNEIGTIVTTGAPVEIVIDTAAPELGEVIIEPSGQVDPGSAVTVKLFTDEDLAEAKLVLDGNIYDLGKMPQGHYQAIVDAPIEFGQYPLNFIIVDQLGNESSFDDQTVLGVGQLAPSDDGQGEGPGNIGNLVARPEDTRVTLTWNAPGDGSAPITNYRVYYGISPNQLTEAVDTFTNATTWYIPNLQNDVEYYFGVIAVDTQGRISQGFNQIVQATPVAAITTVLPPDVINGVAGGDNLDDLEGDVSDTGPEVLWLVLLSILGGLFYGIVAGCRRSGSGGGANCIR